MASRKQQKEEARQRRMEAERAAAARTARFRRMQVAGVAASAVVVAVIVVVVATSSGGTSGGSGPPARLSTTSTAGLGQLRAAPSAGPLGPEGVPIPQAPALASTASAATGQTVDSIQCSAGEQTLFHVHTHLTVFVDGSARQIPYGIGIPPPRQVRQSAQGPFVASGSCFYWLHAHAADGIIHIESPVQRTFTLGDFFDLWGQTLGPNQVGPARGKVTAFYNGALYQGNPRDIPIGRYTQIQLDVGSPLIAPETISFAGTGL
jgi:hypothetical protein